MYLVLLASLTKHRKSKSKRPISLNNKTPKAYVSTVTRNQFYVELRFLSKQIISDMFKNHSTSDRTFCLWNKTIVDICKYHNDFPQRVYIFFQLPLSTVMVAIDNTDRFPKELRQIISTICNGIYPRNSGVFSLS